MLLAGWLAKRLLGLPCRRHPSRTTGPLLCNYLRHRTTFFLMAGWPLEKMQDIWAFVVSCASLVRVRGLGLSFSQPGSTTSSSLVILFMFRGRLLAPACPRHQSGRGSHHLHNMEPATGLYPRNSGGLRCGRCRARLAFWGPLRLLCFFFEKSPWLFSSQQLKMERDLEYQARPTPMVCLFVVDINVMPSVGCSGPPWARSTIQCRGEQICDEEDQHDCFAAAWARG